MREKLILNREIINPIDRSFIFHHTELFMIILKKQYKARLNFDGWGKFFYLISNSISKLNYTTPFYIMNRKTYSGIVILGENSFHRNDNQIFFVPFNHSRKIREEKKSRE